VSAGAAATSVRAPCWARDIVGRSEQLLRGVQRAAYYVNASTLFRPAAEVGGAGGDGAAAMTAHSYESAIPPRWVLDIGALATLLRRLSYLSSRAQADDADGGGGGPTRLTLLVVVSRLPAIVDGAAGAAAAPAACGAVSESGPSRSTAGRAPPN
jgi:hypothetical protein